MSISLLIMQIASAALQPEAIDVAVLPAPTPHRVYVTDSWGTGHTRVIDAQAGEVIGFLHHPPMSNFAVDPQGRWLIVAESIWTRGNRGVRQDLLTLYDARTLELVAEISLPGRLIVGDKPQDLGISADGDFAYVYDMTPANLVHVVDLKTRKRIATVETPGCALVFPVATRAFGGLCAEGAANVVKGDARWRTEQMRGSAQFDPEIDPIIDQGDLTIDGRGYFVAYSGLIYPVDFGAADPLAAPFSIQQAAGLTRAGVKPGEVAWRPGGRQVSAYHSPSGRLFVLMHRGEVWGQNDPGEELWVVDVAQRKVVRRMKVEGKPLNVAVSRDDEPLIYLNGADTLHIHDGATGKLMRTMTGIGTGSIASQPR